MRDHLAEVLAAVRGGLPNEDAHVTRARAAAPVRRQELRRQLRVVQQGSAEGVHQEGLDHEALFRVELAGGAQGPQHRPEMFDELAVAGV